MPIDRTLSRETNRWKACDVVTPAMGPSLPAGSDTVEVGADQELPGWTLVRIKDVNGTVLSVTAYPEGGITSFVLTLP